MNLTPRRRYSSAISSDRTAIHWLKVKLTGTASNRDGLGATVHVTAGGRTLTKYNDGKSGYLSQSSLPLYFGLGDAQKIDRVEVLGLPDASRP